MAGGLSIAMGAVCMNCGFGRRAGRVRLSLGFEWGVMPDRIAYKVMSASELAQMRRDGVFAGSAADVADGYIYLSRGCQLAATVDKHFGGVGGLMVLAVELSRLGDAVRWEPARGGQVFPHIHGLLTVDAVVAVAPLERTPDGAVKLPA